MKFLGKKQWQQWHKITRTVIVVAPLMSGIFIYSYNQSSTARIEQAEADNKAMIAKIDSEIQQLHAKQKADQAAAASTAEQSKTADSASSTKIVCHNLLSSHGNPGRVDILVNKLHCLSPINFAPSDLVTVDNATLSAKAMPYLTDMLNTANTTGVPLTVTSSYRSYADQVATYRGKITDKGNLSGADSVSARPGYSEHQTGLAVDLRAGNCALECFVSTPQYTWLQAHAADYGFIQRYPSGSELITGYSTEPWHYRYVGVTSAKDMKTKGIKTLEEYWHISGGDYPG